jgi:DNA-binding MarR family transcriptional regulator
VHRLLARLETEGLITGDDEVELTDEGKALHTSLREYIAGPTVELLNQFDTGDIETTVRTLRAITQRAAERLAASGR